MLQKLKEMLSENGAVSSTRALAVFVILDIIVSWNIVSIKSGTLQEIPANVACILGAVILGGVGNKFAERIGGKKADDPQSQG